MTRGPGRRLAALAGAQLIVALDHNIVYVALPVIDRELDFGGASEQWVVSSYGLAFGLVTGLSYGLGDSHETMIVIALQIDGQILALPFVAGYYWLRGPRDD